MDRPIVQHPFNPTEVKSFNAGTVALLIEDSSQQFAWQLLVGSKKSHITTHYPGILECEGWMVATAYWEGVLPVMTPFRVTPAVPWTGPGLKGKSNG